MYLTQEQIDVLRQRLRNKRLKIELLDSNMRIVDSIEGHAIGGEITADANNDIRRTGNIQMSIPISPQATTLLDQLDGFTIEIGGKIWLDKYIKIKVGIENILSQNNEIVWYPLGVFLINKPSRTFSDTEYSLSFECIDLMSKLTGQRQGQLTGTTTMIEKGYYRTIGLEQRYLRTRFQDALISTITELGGIKKYSIAPIPDVYQFLPYDIKVGVGATVYDILKELMNILSTWQMYFDLDGTFIVEPIPSGKNDIVYDLDDEQYISNESSADFENVKNQIIVYGRTNNLSYYTSNTEHAATVTPSASANIKKIYFNIEKFEQKITAKGTYSFIWSAANSSWMLGDETIQLAAYGISTIYESLPSDNATITVNYEPAVNDNVQYVNNSDGTQTLVLKYSTLNDKTFTISGVTFGFMSTGYANSLPITKVQLQVGDDIVVAGNLVKFENTTTSFGQEYATKQIEVNSILPNDVYFIRIYSGTLTDDDYVDITQPVTFEFMGKQAVAYNLVNDNIESPFYVNNNIDAPNYYGGEAKTPTGTNLGEGFEITLNNDGTLETLVSGTIITFIANAPNIYAEGKNFSYVNIKQANGASLGTNIPLVQDYWTTSAGTPSRPYLQKNKIANDYTILKCRYEIINSAPNLVLLGRNENVITKICTGGEYDNIYADQLAYERALWELFQHSNLNDNISLGVVPNYSLDVNCKIAFDENDALPIGVYDTQPYDVKQTQTSSNYQQFTTSLGKDFYVKTDNVGYFLTKQITYPLGVDATPQTISAIRIYDSGNLVGN